MTITKFNNTIIFIAILCSVHFFGLYYKFGDKLSVLIDLGFIFCACLFFYTNKKQGTISQVYSDNLTLYVKYFTFFFLFLFISTISCLYFHDQNMLRTIQAMRTFFYFALFFMLIKSSIPKEKLEMFCYFFLFCYCIVFLLQLAIFPTAIVPLGRTDELNRGLLRFRLEGVGFVTLMGMMSLNKFLSTKKIKHIAVLITCFTFIYLLGFRTLLVTYFLSLLLLVYFFYKSLSLALLINALVIGIGIVLYQSGAGGQFIEENIELTSNQLEDFDDYIRVLTYRFLFEDISPNQFALLFGNGFPYLDSQYGYEVLYVGTELNGFIAADLGLLGFAFYFGGITTLIYILMLVTPLFKQFKKDTVYLKVYGLYLVMSSVTTAESFRIGMFGVLCIYFYLVVIESENKRNLP